MAERIVATFSLDELKDLPVVNANSRNEVCPYKGGGDNCNPCSTGFSQGSYNGCGYFKAHQMTDFLEQINSSRGNQ